MDSAHRRMEIISILSAKGHVTMKGLAWELEVSIVSGAYIAHDNE